MKIRCINLDWLEIFAEEPITAPHDAEFFRRAGYKVKERAYGTPQYKEMFTILANGQELFEIRRNPYSKKKEGGIFAENACHIRLCNRTCYEEDPINHLRAFMITHDYTYKSISRIDIALDFNDFDNGERPEHFIERYMKAKVAKINQSNVSAHGTDTWSKRVFNSLKWGSPSSPVSTKLYNKTLELKSGEDKPYIRQAWETAGLDISRDVWRVEFSLSAQMQTLKSLKNGEMFKKSLVHYDSRERLLKQFAILYNKYFDFRKLLVNRKSDGKLVYVRKYLCPRIDLFKIALDDVPFKPVRNVTKKKRPDRIYRILAKRLADIVDNDKNSREVMQAAQTIIQWMIEKMNYELGAYKAATEKMLMILERVNARAEQFNMEDYKSDYEEFVKDKELRILFHLARKYGIVIPPQDCPF